MEDFDADCWSILGVLSHFPSREKHLEMFRVCAKAQNER
jgi:hypothetical protein